MFVLSDMGVGVALLDNELKVSLNTTTERFYDLLYCRFYG